MKKRVLVTGGAGFIGSHLCDYLISNGDEVICVDNLFTGIKDNIRHLLSNPYFEFIRHDVTVPLYVECDEIYHLACPASPIHYQYNPIKTAKTCVYGSVNMLGLAKRTKSKILLASTSEVYGDPLVHPQSEDYWGHVNPIGGRSCYDEGKRMAESFFMDYHRQYGVEIKIARLFNTYGPRMMRNDGRVISNFLFQSLNNEPITIYGQGLQTRSFCYITDMIEGLTKLMSTEESVTGPINLGNPNECEIRELANMIIQFTNSQSTLSQMPLPKDDPKRRKPDISKAERILDWKPKVTLEDGLKLTLEKFKSSNKIHSF